MPPLYEFECPKCKGIVELQQKMTEKVAPLCCEENCNVEMVPIMSRSSFAMVGGCWAKDGYGSKR